VSQPSAHYRFEANGAATPSLSSSMHPDTVPVMPRHQQRTPAFAREAVAQTSGGGRNSNRGPQERRQRAPCARVQAGSGGVVRSLVVGNHSEMARRRLCATASPVQANVAESTRRMLAPDDEQARWSRRLLPGRKEPSPADSSTRGSLSPRTRCGRWLVPERPSSCYRTCGKGAAAELALRVCSSTAFRRTGRANRTPRRGDGPPGLPRIGTGLVVLIGLW
jgi:hypothetical protein